MPVRELHRRVAAVVLRTAARHGFALAGGNALLTYGITTRPTEDVDLFTDDEHGVSAVAASVPAALAELGLRVVRRDSLGGIWPELDEGLAEWMITAPDGEQMMLQMAYFDRSRGPVAMDIGPVLDLEDVVGGKVCALVSRAYERDYIDTSAALARYCIAEVIGFARRLDPGLSDRDFADAGRRLDRLEDEAFARYGLTPPDVALIRTRFAPWPRLPGLPAPVRRVPSAARGR
jgi:hypothetical protein